MAPTHKNEAMSGLRERYRSLFSWESFDVFGPVEISISDFQVRRIFYGHILGGPTSEEVKKNRVFKDDLKFDLNDFRYRSVQNSSKTLQGPTEYFYIP